MILAGCNITKRRGLNTFWNALYITQEQDYLRQIFVDARVTMGLGRIHFYIQVLRSGTNCRDEWNQFSLIIPFRPKSKRRCWAYLPMNSFIFIYLLFILSDLLCLYFIFMPAYISLCYLFVCHITCCLFCIAWLLNLFARLLDVASSARHTAFLCVLNVHIQSVTACVTL